MTEKRFIPIFDGTDKRVVGAKDNGKIISFMDMFDLLNDLSDENEQLRKENDMLSCELSVSANKEISRNCRITELEEENEQLKQYNTELVNKIDFLERVIDGDVWMTEITVKVNTRELTRQLNDLDLLQYQPYELGEFIKENLKVVKIGSSEDIRFYLSLEKGGA